MKRWIVKAGATSLDGLALQDIATPEPGPGEVRIRVRAVSLNARDQLLLSGAYGVAGADFVPVSDGAGEIDAIGAGVRGWSVGDRVAGLYFGGWREGPPPPGMGWGLGSEGQPGMLAESVVLPAARVARIPGTLSFEEAACLPCAALTAWSALNGDRPYRRPIAKGDKVLVTGTGSVALFALRFAVAAGARVVATSSDAAKAERVKALGALDVFNYRTEPEWGQRAAERLGGADHVVIAAGSAALDQAIAALALGGEIALMGLYEHAQAAPNFVALMTKGGSIRGTAVGSALAFGDMVDFIETHGIEPVLGGSFAFDDAKDAYRAAASGEVFGKVVIRLPG